MRERLEDLLQRRSDEPNLIDPVFVQYGPDILAIYDDQGHAANLTETPIVKTQLSLESRVEEITSADMESGHGDLLTAYAHWAAEEIAP